MASKTKQLIDELQRLVEGRDIEATHSRADDILVEFIQHVVKGRRPEYRVSVRQPLAAYAEVPKWYA